MPTSRRSLNGFVLVLLAACAGRAPLPAPTSLQVDVEHDIVIVPAEVCPKFGGWIAMTENAVRLQELQRLEEDRQCHIAAAEAQGAQFIAETQRDQALQAVDQAGFWAKWGFPLGLLSGLVVTTAGAVLIWEVSHAH